MPLTDAAPVISVIGPPAGRIAADLLIVPVFEDDDLADLPELEPATDGTLTNARRTGAVSGKLYQTWVGALGAPNWSCRRLLLVGAGPRGDATIDTARRVAAAGTLTARQMRAERLAIVDRFGGATYDGAHGLAEGIVTASFATDAYKTGEHELSRIAAGVIITTTAETAEAQRAAERGAILGDCCNVAKTLVQEPGNVLPPRVFAERVAAIGAAAGLGVDVLDEAAIETLKMGLLLGVARGSAEPPRLIVLRHDPPGAPADRVLGLVGKGITFDTGGISIKPAENMDKMKDDMSGGAAVVGAMRALAMLQAPVKVLGLVPCAENMPGARAIRPGDILTSASGTTVEVLNTDAEGRLVLGDALWYARQLGATRLVDVATLTGACVVALGKTTSGLFGTPDRWVELVHATAERAGDRIWPMPVFDDYREQLKSEIADIANIGTRAGGAITAAMFLKEFTGGLPWVHLDIAGTAWAEEACPYQPKGPTGVAVRTLAELAFTSDRW